MNSNTRDIVPFVVGKFYAVEVQTGFHVKKLICECVRVLKVKVVFRYAVKTPSGTIYFYTCQRRIRNVPFKEQMIAYNPDKWSMVGNVHSDNDIREKPDWWDEALAKWKEREDIV